MTNEQLAERIQVGEAGLLPLLWDQVYALICWYANRFYSQCRERCEASGTSPDDLVQEGFFAVLDAVKAYDPAAAIVDIVPDIDAQAAYEAFEDGMVNAELKAALDDCFATLPEDAREIIRRRYYGGQTLQVILPTNAKRRYGASTCL